MTKKTATSIKQVSEDEIPEVLAYVEEMNMLYAFKEQHRNIFETYTHLVDTVNQRRDIADKAVRAKEVSCGPWQVIRTVVTYNKEKLLEAIGHESFVRLGGQAIPRVEYEISKDSIEVAIAKKQIDDQLVAQIKTEKKHYSAPKDL